MITYYCPNCWVELTSIENICPGCGYQLEAYADLTLEEKLVMALNHPVAENRMLAVQILGKLGSVLALPQFENIITDRSADVYLQREVIKALARIDDPKTVELLQKALHHRSPLISQLAREHLQTILGRKGKPEPEPDV